MAARKNVIEVLGLQESLRAFDSAKEAFGVTPLKECLLPIAERIRDHAKTLVPLGRKPGPSLRRRIKAVLNPGRSTPEHLKLAIFAVRGKPDLPSVIVGVDRKRAPHAHLVEFGHGGPHPAPAHPYLRPAFDAVKRAAVAMVGKEIKDRIIAKLERQYKRESAALASAARRKGRNG